MALSPSQSSLIAVTLRPIIMGPWDLLLPAQHKGRILVIIVTSGLYIWTSYILGNKALLFPHTRAPHMDIHGDKHIGVFGKTWDGEDGGGFTKMALGNGIRKYITKVSQWAIVSVPFSSVLKYLSYLSPPGNENTVSNSNFLFYAIIKTRARGNNFTAYNSW